MRRRSLHLRLLIWLLVPLAAVLCVNLVATYYFAWRPARDAYDRALADVALAVTERLRVDDGQLELDLPAAVERVLRFDGVDVVYVAVRDGSDQYVAGDPALADYRANVEIPDGGTAFFYGELHGKPVRIAVVPVRTYIAKATVQVAETTVKRTRLRFEILTSSLISTLVLGVAMAGVAGYGVRRGLAPLERTRRAISARSVRDLRPVDSSAMPTEVLPLVDSINDLLARLEQAARTQRRFIADAAHQLRTPLAGLLTQVAAAERLSDPDSLRHSMEQIRITAERTARLASQLLALARAEPGAMRNVPFKLLDLAELLGTEADAWVREGIERGIDVGFDLDSASMEGDSFLLTELARNLVDNAFQYAGAGHSVTVRSRTERPANRARIAVLEVEDDGPGLPEEERERVFERFYRAPGSSGSGSGLGLAIVREIAIAHNGWVSIESGERGQGTRVAARFEVAGREVAHARPSSHAGHRRKEPAWPAAS